VYRGKEDDEPPVARKIAEKTVLRDNMVTELQGEPEMESRSERMRNRRAAAKEDTRRHYIPQKIPSQLPDQ
jgi:hypothetical protein